MKLLGILVIYATYESNYTEIINNLKRYLQWVDKLIVWDNTPDVSHIEVLMKQFDGLLSSEEFLKIHFMGSGKNEGLSYAYNRAIEYASRNGYTHLMTMDQDSQWENFDKYREFAENFFHEGQLAIIGPIINGDEQIDTLKEVPNLINSGAIIPIGVFDRMGGYCERFLVDAVDVELCYRAQRYGIPVLKVKDNGHLIQKYGNMSFFRFNGRQWHCTNYNTFRLKGILRNHTLLLRIYPEQTDNKDRLLNVYLKQYTIAIILKEKHKIKKLWIIYSSFLKGMCTKKSLDAKYSKA